LSSVVHVVEQIDLASDLQVFDENRAGPGMNRTCDVRLDGALRKGRPALRRNENDRQ